MPKIFERRRDYNCHAFVVPSDSSFLCIYICGFFPSILSSSSWFPFSPHFFFCERQRCTCRGQWPGKSHRSESYMHPFSSQGPGKPSLSFTHPFLHSTYYSITREGPLGTVFHPPIGPRLRTRQLINIPLPSTLHPQNYCYGHFNIFSLMKLLCKRKTVSIMGIQKEIKSKGYIQPLGHGDRPTRTILRRKGW